MVIKLIGTNEEINKDLKLFIEPLMLEFKKEKERLNEVLNIAYSERNYLAAICVKLALKLGLSAGKGIDDNEAWDIEWRNVLYIDLPEGQISYHIAPNDLEVIYDLPIYTLDWEGTYNSKDIEFIKKVLK